ncbi:MAG: glycosyltransferase family 2 protein, partial [Vicinamibacterales bacterium]
RYAALDPRVTHIRFERNIGLPALTTGLALPAARGEYLAWCFDDCVLFPDHLAELSGALDRDPRIGLASGRVEVPVSSSQSAILGGPLAVEKLREGSNYIPNVGVIFRRSVVDDVGWYDPNVILKRQCDWDLWLRIARKYSTGFVDRVVAREHGVTQSDSIGHDNSIRIDLVLKYVDCDRDAMLRPAVLAAYDPFSVAHVTTFTPQDIEAYRRLLLEHFVKICDVRKAIEIARTIDDPALRRRVRAQNPEVADDDLLLLMESLAAYRFYREGWLKQRIREVADVSEERLELLLEAQHRDPTWLRIGRRIWRLLRDRSPKSLEVTR